jgi:hypothetical protein
MTRNRYLGLLLAGIGIALVVTLFSPFASGHPDGLERVAEDKGFIERAENAPYEILPDYTIPGIEDERLTTILAGVVGVIVVGGLTYGLAALLGRRNRATSRDTSPPSH